MRDGERKTCMPFAWPTPRFEVGQIVRFCVPAGPDNLSGIPVRITQRSVVEYMSGGTSIKYEVDWFSDSNVLEGCSVSEDILEEIA